MSKGNVSTDTKMKGIVSLCKRRGFIFQSSEIYGGLRSCYDYGPLGVELKKNVKEEWWKSMVHRRDDIVGLDCSIIMHPKVWEASGHLAGFTDPLVDCRNCKERFRADHAPKADPGSEVEYKEGGKSSGKKLKGVVPDRGYVCPNCGSGDLSDERLFNLMFRTNLGVVDPMQQIANKVDDLAKLDMDERRKALSNMIAESAVYLRPETAQGMFVNFNNIMQSSRVKLPFGIAQMGKSYRNEVTPGNLTFRTCEFEQMEMEFFVKPGADEEWYDYWHKERFNWYLNLGIDKDKLRMRDHEDDELAHYAKACADVEYFFPFENDSGEGEWAELEGIANRTDYDLKKHSEYSGKDLIYFDQDAKEKFVPYVIEPAAGADRATLAFLCDAYEEEEIKEGDVRTVLKFNPKLAPIKAAVFPLVKKDGMPEKANQIHKSLLEAGINSQYDQAGAVGRRYRRMDEVGTPWCLTVDGDTIEDGTVTVRDRDTMDQERIPSEGIVEFIKDKLQG
jgi:glycyl-tRNA synthetase